MGSKVTFLISSILYLSDLLFIQVRGHTDQLPETVFPG